MSSLHRYTAKIIGPSVATFELGQPDRSLPRNKLLILGAGHQSLINSVTKAEGRAGFWVLATYNRTTTERCIEIKSEQSAVPLQEQRLRHIRNWRWRWW